MAGTYNFLKRKRGDTFLAKRLILTSNGLPLNLSGAVIKMQVRKISGGRVFLQWSTSDNTITISGADNNIITLAKRVQMDLQPYEYVYDLQVTFPGGEVKTILEGTFEIAIEITK